VLAYFYEPGQGVCGKFSTYGPEWYVIDGDADWVRRHIPIDINEAMYVSDDLLEDSE